MAMKTKTVTFDFDNTIAMSHMDLSSGDVEFIFDEYNDEIIKLIKKSIKNGDDVHIVTSRTKEKEGLFPEDTVKKHLDKLSLSDYFWPDRVHYTNGSLKAEKLKELGSMLHYDDDIEEHVNNFGTIKTKNPYDFYEDTEFVGKCIIYDSEDRILILRRTDEGEQWDIPGGHLKDIEVKRGDSGCEDGTERELMEETGLILPFIKQIGDQAFTFRGKNSNILFYLSKFDEPEPEVNLTMQDFQENSEYKWVAMDEMSKYAKNGTQVLQKAVEFAKIHGLLTEEERYQRLVKKKHSKMKKKLIGYGLNKEFGGGEGHTRPKMTRSKSAPPGFGAIGEEKSMKKHKIKIKITDNIDEKRKKRRKKRRKQTKKRRNYGASWPYIGGYIGTSDDSFGDSGDGGGGE
jgi:ADP-ribose pyrophosphatase YjhB (NUDIX family)